MKHRKHRKRRGQGWVIAAIIVLLAILGGLMLYQRHMNAVRRSELKAAAKERAASSTSEVPISAAPAEGSEPEYVTTEPAGLTQSDTEQASEASEASETTQESSMESTGSGLSETDSGSEQTEYELPAGFSIRGDDFHEDSSGTAGSYASKLETLLTENGFEIPVEDNTWLMAGTLSQMALAGVSEDEIDAYIAAHQQAAAQGGYEARATDIRVRDDLAEKRTVRDDLGYFPIILMGYYGGWGGSPEELVEQEKLILATYGDPEEYLIVGVHPYVYDDDQAYDAAQEEAFGEQYLSLSTVTGGVRLMTDAGRSAIAEAIYEKLNALGVLREE